MHTGKNIFPRLMEKSVKYYISPAKYDISLVTAIVQKLGIITTLMFYLQIRGFLSKLLFGMLTTCLSVSRPIGNLPLSCFRGCTVVLTSSHHVFELQAKDISSNVYLVSVKIML